VTPCLLVWVPLHLVNAVQGIVMFTRAFENLCCIWCYCRGNSISIHSYQSKDIADNSTRYRCCMVVTIGQIHSLWWVNDTRPGKPWASYKARTKTFRWWRFYLALSLKFNCDRTREVVGTDLSLSPDALLNFPKSDDHTLRDLKQLLSGLAFFCGNHDAKYGEEKRQRTI